MAEYKQHTEPLSSHYSKSDHLIPPLHRPPPPKRASKCFVYFFAFFVLLCLLLLIFSLLILRPKPLPLRLSSPSLNSLTYDQTPSFSASFSAQISIPNPNFAPLTLRSASLSFLHGNSSAGSGSASLRSLNRVIGCRSQHTVKVSATAAKWTLGIDWDDHEKNKLRDELNSGVLMLNGILKAEGQVVWFKRIARNTYGQLECHITIDLRSHQLITFLSI